MVIEYDTDSSVERKITRSLIDSTTTVTFTEESGSAEWNTIKNHQDFPKVGGQQAIQFVPYWGSFVYIVKQYLFLKEDTSYTKLTPDAMLDQSDDDPCLRGKHLFQNGDDGGDLQHHRIMLKSSLSSNYNHAIAMEYAFDSLWIILSQDQKILFRVAAVNQDPSPPDPGNLIVSEFFTAANLDGNDALFS